MPPISVYRIGDMHFVKDGHHRVSVARAMGRNEIDAYVTQVITEMDPSDGLRLGDLPLKGHERVFYERVPLPSQARERIQLSDRWDYAALAEGVEAWGFRAIQRRGELMSRTEVADAWLREDYLLMRTHAWDTGVLERVARELR
jgi:hypothetical protein